MSLRSFCSSLSGLLIAGLLVMSCASEVDAPGGTRPNFRPKPRGYGDVNRVTVIADEVLLEGVVGDSLYYYYEQAYPLMPQPEAIFDLVHFTPQMIDALPARKELRTYLVLADLKDESSLTLQLLKQEIGEEKIFAAREDYRKGTAIVSDRWATDQTVIFLMAEGPDELAKLLVQSFPAAKAKILEADRNKLEANIYQSGRSTVVRDSVVDLTGIHMDIPKDYRLARADDQLVWLRRDLGAITQNIIVSSVAYTGENQLSKDSIVAFRNMLGKAAVRSNTPGSYMTSNDIDLPVLTEVTEINGAYAVEARGIWEMTNDFMGGPYFTYVIPDSKKGRLYIIDAFTFAPSKGKRNYMQQLEVIARSAKIVDAQSGL